MRTRSLPTLLAALALAALAGTARVAGAQAPAADPTDRLKVVLPADVAEHVLATIADARARQLPADALAQRALKFAAKGVPPERIAGAIDEQARRMDDARSALQRGRPAGPSGDEIEAGAEAMRRGVSGAEVSALAKSAPSGRSLAVPLFVVGNLVDRGLPSDEALQRVRERLAARAADADIERLPADVGGGRDQADPAKGRPAETGRDLAKTKKPGGTGGDRGNGPPAGVPANTGKQGRPQNTGKPVTPRGNRP